MHSMGIYHKVGYMVSIPSYPPRSNVDLNALVQMPLSLLQLSLFMLVLCFLHTVSLNVSGY